MSCPLIHFRQCEAEKCRFRFPVTDERRPGESCPQCGAPTQPVGMAGSPISREAPNHPIPATGPVVEVLLDNIRSVYNVGSMFRTADGAGIDHLYLCGITAPPHHPKITKTALGAEEHIPWSHHPNGLDTVVRLKEQGKQLWGLESNHTGAESLFSVTADPQGPPLVLVVGNEIAGIDPHILAQCDRILFIPMQGSKQSLNAAVAFGIAVYHLQHGQLS